MDLLKTGLQQMQIDLPPEAQTKLMEYVQLLIKWNQKFNLTAVRDFDNIITLHILDSLSVLPFISAVNTVLDVGTGAGLPGIPLAIARPDIHFTLVDSQQKKINFVQHVITSLQLTNVAAVWQRIESLQVNSPIDMVVTRAFASLSEFVNLVVRVCNSQTMIVAMKGRFELVQAEQTQLPDKVELVNIEKVTIPGLDAERCLVFMKLK